ncbi:hypothetical protein [Ferrovibrio sp.]|uniref:hypothetical protein n=1 Tax=Ferrovibrio sp. TaxID=1917215 RepID=UPI003518DB69
MQTLTWILSQPLLSGILIIALLVGGFSLYHAIRIQRLRSYLVAGKAVPEKFHARVDHLRKQSEATGQSVDELLKRDLVNVAVTSLIYLVGGISFVALDPMVRGRPDGQPLYPPFLVPMVDLPVFGSPGQAIVAFTAWLIVFHVVALAIRHLATQNLVRGIDYAYLPFGFLGIVLKMRELYQHSAGDGNDWIGDLIATMGMTEASLGFWAYNLIIAAIALRITRTTMEIRRWYVA